jgi:hypothetical protein
VIANDYVPIIPYTTKVVTLAIGQRADVLVTASGSKTDAVWMRSDLDVPCMALTCTNSHALAAVYYDNANTTVVPTTTGASWDSNDCANVSVLIIFCNYLNANMPHRIHYTSLHPIRPSNLPTAQQ